MFNGEVYDEFKFRNNGRIYGPIRLVDIDNDRIENVDLVRKICDAKFISNKKCIFFVRDPRDMLISSYFSFGFSHRLSEVEHIREHQLENKKSISNMEIDEFSFSRTGEMKKKFELMQWLIDKCNNYILLKYEDMIETYEDFFKKLSQFIPLKSQVKNNMYQLSRPQEREDITKHKRSGKVSGYKEKLKKDTISKINGNLGDVLSYFEYRH
jgi:hypothetical protein